MQRINEIIYMSSAAFAAAIAGSEMKKQPHQPRLRIADLGGRLFDSHGRRKEWREKKNLIFLYCRFLNFKVLQTL